MSKVITAIEHVIIGTAGHIDHGKTALVKALTGIDADTLAEEKKRGITIELGFVFMPDSGEERQIVFIDVPGHEKLVKTMVAGASNIDAALLVIAADEGIRAQTMEHFDILKLMGIKTGIIALAKLDLVDSHRLNAVSAEITEFVSGSFLDGAPIIPVSSVTGDGVEDVKFALREIAGKITRGYHRRLFRMPVDRVFTMPGFGTVIAGTILSGEIKTGDTIEILPEGISARVRGLQINNQFTDKSCTGRRTAINLQNIDKEKLYRGQCAGTPETLFPTNRLDTRLHLLQSWGRGLKNRTRVRLHIGTAEIISRVILLDRENLAPGQTGPVQFVLERKTTALPADRFVIRSFSPLRTIGGGLILDACPRRHKRFDANTLTGIEALEGTPSTIVEQMIKKTRFAPRYPAEVARELGEKEEKIQKLIAGLTGEGKLIAVTSGSGEARKSSGCKQRYIHREPYNRLAEKLLAIVNEYLAGRPACLFAPITEVQSQFQKYGDRDVLESIINSLCEQGVVSRKGSGVNPTGYQAQLKEDERAIARHIEKHFREGGFAPPREEEVCRELGIARPKFDKLLNYLIEKESLRRLDDKVIYHREHLDAAQKLISEHLRKKGGVTVAQLRDDLGVSRKYALALLEYFDNTGFTRRKGDIHIGGQPRGG